MSELYIGLMSGTSLDGIDGVLVDFSETRAHVLQHADAPFGSELRHEMLALNASGPDELHRSALAGNSLARLYADVVDALITSSGVARADVKAIGAHGQTVRHRPQCFDGSGYTIQLNNPSLLAELTGLTVVADFRGRDIAAGGQGAPLVPAFHQAFFGAAGRTLAILNIGGISNLTILPSGSAPTSGVPQSVVGFDCGPGNTLLDHWCQTHTGQAFDAGGQWAASGHVVPQLLEQLLAEPFFALPPPKSTGRDLFNSMWLDRILAPFCAERPEDVQATLTELTAQTCHHAVTKFAPECTSLIVCGGGALNVHLMTRVASGLPGVRVESSAMHGLPPQWVEATAFAWLARKTMRGETGNLRTVTGARAERILGAIYPG